MATNQTLRVDNIVLVTPELIKKGIETTLQIGTTSTAPLGSSGDTIILFQRPYEGSFSRPSQISVRKYNNDVELLVTNQDGSFLFYGRYDISVGIDFLSEEYYRVIRLLGDERILGTIKKKIVVKKLTWWQRFMKELVPHRF